MMSISVPQGMRPVVKGGSVTRPRRPAAAGRPQPPRWPMVANKASTGKRYFTLAEANATLPYVRAIVRDIAELAHELRDRHERLGRLTAGESGSPSEAHREELLQAAAAVEQGQERM